MNKYFLSALFICASLNIFGCNNDKSDQQQTSENYSQIQEIKKAPDFTLVSTDGGKINLSDYKGKIVILDFWATWCGPCRRGIPDLVSIQKIYKDKVVIIGISLDDDRTKDDVVPFLKEYEVNYPVVFGTSEVVTDFGGISAIPTSFIIDQKGNIVDKYMGLVSKEVFVGRIKDLSGS